ncbi:MAG: hypothetical protein Q4C42_05155 [Clostridia bacterium]|nr:hypothetical protein [Clostridia bacterium]
MITQKEAEDKFCKYLKEENLISLTFVEAFDMSTDFYFMAVKDENGEELPCYSFPAIDKDTGEFRMLEEPIPM